MYSFYLYAMFWGFLIVLIAVPWMPSCGCTVFLKYSIKNQTNMWPHRWKDRPCALWSISLHFPYICFFSTPGIAESLLALHQLQIPHPLLHNICQASCSPSHSYGSPFLGASLMLVLIQSHPSFTSSILQFVTFALHTDHVLQHIWISSHHYIAPNLQNPNLHSAIHVVKECVRWQQI